LRGENGKSVFERVKVLIGIFKLRESGMNSLNCGMKW